MCSKDLGVFRQQECNEFAKIFRCVFTGNTQIDTSKEINKIIRGFIINERMHDECNVVECYDLCYVNITTYGASELDWYLMNKLGWEVLYQYAINN